VASFRRISSSSLERCISSMDVEEVTNEFFLKMVATNNPGFSGGTFRLRFSGWYRHVIAAIKAGHRFFHQVIGIFRMAG